MSSKRKLPPFPLSRSFQSEYGPSYSESIDSKTSIETKVHDPLYRDFNLVNNNVHLRMHETALPSTLLPLIDKVHAHRLPPPPLIEYDSALAYLGYGNDETDVEYYFKRTVFPKSKEDAFRSDKKIMFQHAVPRNPDSQYRISQLLPNVTYGYLLGAFDESQQIELSNARKDAAANAKGFFYPFFVIKMKAGGPHGREGVSTSLPINA